jgi:hypothetical protein
MKSYCILLVILSISYTSSAFCQDSLSTDYPFLYKVTANCVANYDANEKMYYYSYTLVNDNYNKGNIWAFNVDIRRRKDATLYDTLGLNFWSKLEQIYFQRDYPPAAELVEAVGFPKLPGNNWVADIEHASVASFGVDTLMPEPGQRVSGIEMMSKSLPGIRSFVVMPDFNVYEFFPDLEDTTATMTVEQMDSIRDAVNYRGWTIGPTAPPLNCSASSWIDTLASYKHQCVTLGWLTNGPEHDKDEDDDKAEEGIVERLDRRLDKAKAAILKSDSVKARLELELFVKEVEQLYHKNKDEGLRKGVPSLTSEGYALLKYNAEYLIDRLPKRHERGEDEKGKIQR